MKIFLIILIILLLKYLQLYKKNIKVCLCTVGKLENKYIKEFVEYYKKYGIDKIFLYDNNEINGENFNLILDDYIKNDYVEILNFRGIEGKQHKILQNCYKKNNKNYNWLIFYDIDEFIHLKNFDNIKKFLNQKKFNKCQSIYLNWIIHTDNNLKYYDNRTLQKRFSDIYLDKSFCKGKTIIRGNLTGINIVSTHVLDYKIKRCNGFGKIFKAKGIFCDIPDYKYNYIDHYFSKSTEEFINKIKKGDGVFGYSNKKKYNRINFYFKFNTITFEKIKFIAKKTGLNLSIIINNINQKFNKTFF